MKNNRLLGIVLWGIGLAVECLLLLLKLNLIKRASDDTESDIYYLIAERGIEIRNE